MNGIVINIDPVIFRLGHLELRWYSLAIILAIIAAVLITAYRAKKKGIATEHIYSLALWVVLGGIVGARLFHVIDHWEHYMNNPAQILGFQGLAIWGALVGGGLALIIYARIRHLPLGRLVDVVAPGLLVAQIIGRFGCIVNGDAYGGITSVPWAFIYVNPGSSIPSSLFGMPTHPYPVYEMLWNAIALLVLLRLDRRVKKDGLVFLSYLSPPLLCHLSSGGTSIKNAISISVLTCPFSHHHGVIPKEGQSRTKDIARSCVRWGYAFYHKQGQAEGWRCC